MKAPETVVTQGELLPCRSCGEPCSVQIFDGPGVQATLWMCSAHRKLGGACLNDDAYLTAEAWNHRPPPLQSGEIGELVEKLNRAAAQSSEILRSMAEAKSLRQESNPEGRTDLYMWPSPEQTIEGRAAAIITALQAELASARKVVEPFADEFDMYDGEHDDTDQLADIPTEFKIGHLRAARDWLTANGGE